MIKIRLKDKEERIKEEAYSMMLHLPTLTFTLLTLTF